MLLMSALLEPKNDCIDRATSQVVVPLKGEHHKGNSLGILLP